MSRPRILGQGLKKNPGIVVAGDDSRYPVASKAEDSVARDNGLLEIAP
jgi:hypothetical protein